jgi:tetratricopeptide (TPR) repeat protein
LSGIGPLYRVLAVLRPRTRRRLGGALALALAAGCGAPRHEVREERAPTELLVEVLPRRAEVTLDGVSLGPGSRTIPAPRAGEHVLVVAADGYEGVTRPLPEDDLAGARVAEALRPDGFAAARPLDYDDPEGLALAAAFLAAGGDARDAADYAERALALDPAHPLAHRARGDALARLGEGARAAEAWEEYLRRAPDAPDAAAVAERIEAARTGAAPR